MDCTNIYNFQKEWKRRNKYLVKTGLEPMKFTETKFDSIEVLQGFVNSLQKWSDEHKLMTRAEKFTKLLNQNGFDPKELFDNCDEAGGYLPCLCSCECKECEKYWREEVEDE